MSQSPLEEADTVQEYSYAWAAVAWLLRKGQTWSGHERNGAFLGKGDGRFTECGAVLGLDQVGDGRSVVRVDWDGDGDLDLFLRSRTAPRLMYLENRLPLRGKSVQFKLVGRSSSRTVVGARLSVRGPGEEDPLWIRTRRAGEGYLAQSSAWLHVGVGDLPEVLVQVRWPDGKVDDYGTVETDNGYILVQGESEVREWVRPPAGDLAGRTDLRPESGLDANQAAIDTEGRFVLAAPLPLPHIPVTTKAGSRAVLGGIAESLHGRERSAMVLLLWSADCAPCLKELAAWSSARTAVKDAGLSVLALQMRAETEAGVPSDWLEKIQWPYAQGTCSPETARIFAALTSQVTGSTRPLAVPLALLIDGRGRLQVLYRGGVEPDRVFRDQSMFPLQGPLRLRAAFPFDGLFLDPYKQPNWVLLARSFRAGGLPEVAKEYELALVRTDSLDSAESLFQLGQARLRQQKFELAVEHFAGAVQAGPGVVRYLEALAFSQYRLGAMVEARASFQSILELDARHSNTLYNLGFLLIQVEEVAEAQALLQRLRPLDQKLAKKLRAALLQATQETSDAPAGKQPGPTQPKEEATPKSTQPSLPEGPHSDDA